ncbi:MAG: hypothetical protein EBY17_06110 [Acidobacteriia bacterium]|jgi:hypothetical protein|nr:hypothetical protein [Terriglobia bacterium]
MQELINSIVRLSAAATLYSMQQVQSSVSDFDTKESLQSLRQVMDGVASALISKLDESKKEILVNITETGSDVAVAIERDIKEIRDTADDVFHRTLKATKEISHIGKHREATASEVKPMASVKKAATSPRKAKTAAAKKA